VSESFAQPTIGARFERLRAKDFRTLFIWILIGLVGAGVAWRYFFQAFPQASINFQVSRSEALDRARNFISQQGASLEGYQSTIVFSVDDEAKTYLERTIGLERANRLMSSNVSVWYWEVRFFRPLQKEEFRAQISPAGHIVAYEHLIEEASPGARLDRDAAQAIAGQFLRVQYGAGLDAYDFLPEESNSTERPNRRDWSFTWQRRGFRVPDNPTGAPYQLRVGLQGSQIGSSEEFLKVPDAWKRDFDRLRSANNLIETIAILPYMLLLGAAFWVIYDLSRRGLLRGSQALWLGVFFALLYFFMTMSDWPLTRAEYNTDSSYSAFALGQIVIAAALSIGQALLVSLAVAPGEPLYRATQPARVKLGMAWRLPGLRSKEFFIAGIIGLSLAAVHIGYVVTFYLVGKRFGVWAPQDLNIDNSTSSILPWLGPLTIGLYAAASEEFLFRMFAIPFIHRITRSKVIAVILPAFMWGFLHANYPQEPPYIRGIEIGLIGIVAGLVMLRWGILATLVWHYTVDATLGSLLLLRSASPYLRISGALVTGAAFIPLLYCGVMYLKRGGFEVREDILNSSEPLPAPDVSEAQAAVAATADGRSDVYESMPRRSIWILAVCGIVGVAVLAFTHTQAIGSFARTSMDARQAGAMADEVLRGRRVDPASYHRTVIFVPNFDPAADEFLSQKVGISGANRIYEQQIPEVFWRARYFRDSDPEEFVVLFRTDGGLHSVWHTLAESAAGANLSKDAAMALAQTWLRDDKHLDFTAWRLADATSEKKPNRTDHVFIWEQITPLAGGPAPEDTAYARVELRVLGDEVSTYRTYIKLPEDWVRRQQRETVPKLLHTVWRYLFYAVLAALILVIYFRNLKLPAASSIPWRRFAKWSLWGLAAYVISDICSLHAVLNAYQTQLPLKVFAATIGIGWLIGAAFFFSVITFLFGLAWFFWTRAGRGDNLPGWLHMPANYYRDAFLVALLGGATWLGFGRLLSAASQKIFGAGAGVATFAGFDSSSPAAQAIAGTVFTGLLLTGFVATLAGFISVNVRKAWLRVALVIAAAFALAGSAASSADFARGLSVQLLTLCFVWWGVSRIIRFNLLAYFLLAAALLLVNEGISLIEQPNSFLRTNGAIVFGACALLLLWPLAAWRRAAGSPTVDPSL
jgi:membrane protease YdiL (CAAX protease family)